MALIAGRKTLTALLEAILCVVEQNGERRMGEVLVDTARRITTVQLTRPRTQRRPHTFFSALGNVNPRRRAWLSALRYGASWLQEAYRESAMLRRQAQYN